MQRVRFLAVTAMLLVGCGEGTHTVLLDGRTANDHGTEDVTGESSVELELGHLFFAPTILTGRPGQDLTLDARSDEHAHTFTIEERGIDVEVLSGQRRHILVTIPESGMLVFVCRYHADQGMIGALAVTGGP